MKTTDFTEHQEVRKTLTALRRGWDDRQVSDIVDAEGRQYVDLVMEGGGVLGIALVGYTYVLEQMGIRFLGIGGTSAGAINAMLLAAVDSPAQEKSGRILELLAALDMASFVDGAGDARDFVDALVEGGKTMRLVWKGWQVIDNIRDDLGLNPGKQFRRWMAASLRRHGIRTTAELRQRLHTLPRLEHRLSGQRLGLRAAKPRLALVAAEVRTESKVLFPEMADLFYREPDRVNPAEFVRASMSIPYFFHPHRVGRIPKGQATARRWRRKVKFRGTPPSEAVFIDGGIMSNFPIDLFHASGVPDAPTFGVKLGRDREELHDVDGPFQLLGAIFNSARHCRDLDIFLKHPDFEHLVQVVPTGGHNWLDFALSPEAKIDLFARGAKAAASFLRGFDWERYKEVRRAAAC